MTTPAGRTRLLVAVGAAALTGLVGYAAGSWRAGTKPTAPTSAAAPANAGAGRKVLYWYDPMIPQQHSPTPGKSSMGMEMIPKYADDAGTTGAPGVRIDPAEEQNLGLRTAVATLGELPSAMTATGAVDFDERDLAIVQPRAAGFVQRVYQRAPGDIVRAGAPMADLLIPEWGGAQAEFLAVRRVGDPRLAAAARERLHLLGMSDALIAAVERQGRPNSVVTITTPVGGAIQKLDVRPGMSVSAGETLAEVNSLSNVWVTAAVPEAEAGLVHEGQGVTITLDAFPGQTFKGRVQALLPQLADASRTLQARIELPNPGLRLRPGMFATVAFAGPSQSALLIPSEAVIRTGTRDLVMLAEPYGRFRAAEVRLGREAGDRTEVLAGLQAGERVVASGQFLLDSEASLSGLTPRPIDAVPPTPPTGASAMPPTAKGIAQTTGRVETVSPTAITISHQPVPSIGWPAMTMTFRVLDPALTKGVKVGDQVRFAFDQPADGPTLRMLSSVGGANR